MTPLKEYKFNEEKESEDENDETEDEGSGENEDSAEDQSVDETLIPNRPSKEPPAETMVSNFIPANFQTIKNLLKN